MRKIKLAVATVVCLASSAAMAAPTGACSGGTGTAVTAASAGNDLFVKVGFTPKCSANTYVSYDQNATSFGVGAVSLKGGVVFQGSSNGGGVGVKANCNASPCTTGEADAAATAGMNAS